MPAFFAVFAGVPSNQFMSICDFRILPEKGRQG
jgi:hypothetical protein